MSRFAHLPRPVLQAIALAVVMAAAAHLGHLPLWVHGLLVAAIALRLALREPPGRWVLVPLVVAAFAAVIIQFQSISGTTAGGTFFTAMLALKFLESRDNRDAGLLICLTYFHATSIFLTTQSIGMAVYVLFSLGVTTVALTVLAAPHGPPLRLRVRHAALLLLQAVPIMLVLFVLFPRIPGPLWALGGDDRAARTGLSDSMSPGSITNLIESSEVAFRVQFDGEPPANGRRYWRGPVFWAYDGRTWSRGEAAREDDIPEPIATGERADYVLIMEPHQRRWLFGLDVPLAPPDAKRRPGSNLLLDDRLDAVRRFEMRSILDYRLEPVLADARRKRALQLPPGAAPRARELARRWREASDDPRGIVERALRHFREGGFEYTLTPPALGAAPVDQFLFSTRAGFCEHFASAFTVLMRAAGVPARVVTGYLGGETNALGDYMIVRQSDAHAWSEVWLPERGWTRIDPTSAVSSERIDTGIGSVSGAADRLPALSRADGGWLRSAALAWDSVNHAWNRLVLGYGPELQQRLLANLGLGRLGQYALAAMAIASAALAMAAVWLLARRRPRAADPARRAWERALRRLRRAGIEPAANEGPRALAERVRRERPELAPEFDRIARLYVAWRYAGSGTRAIATGLERAVRRFRPRRRRGHAQSTG